MTDLFIRPGFDPQPLPFDAHDETGRLWTDLAGSAEGRKATGWNKPAPAQPPFDPATQAMTWSGTAWVVSDLPPPTPTSADVNAERDRRIRAGFMFAGTPFDYDDSSQKRITGAATLAGFAAAAGAQPGDLRWHGGTEDFVWIAQDNSLVPMDAPTCFTFGQAAAAWESANVFAAKAIKDSGIPANYADDALWPA